MKITKAVFALGSKLISTKQLCRWTGPVIIHPFYHTVSNRYLPHIHPLYTPKTIEQFKADLDFLCRYFRPLSIEQVLEYSFHPETLKENAFHLSFDDGLAELYTVVMPILEERNIPATVFINPAFVDNKEMFYRHKQAVMPKNTPDDYLREQKPYLTTGQLKEMQQKGFTIGAHGIDHTPFDELTEEQQINQIIESCAYVEEHFGEPCRYFAFPFTDEGVSDAVFTEAYKQGINLTFGISASGNRFCGKHIARIDMENYGRSAKEAINKALLKGIICNRSSKKKAFLI